MDVTGRGDNRYLHVISLDIFSFEGLVSLRRGPVHTWFFLFVSDRTLEVPSTPEKDPLVEQEAEIFYFNRGSEPQKPRGVDGGRGGPW